MKRVIVLLLIFLLLAECISAGAADGHEVLISGDTVLIKSGGTAEMPVTISGNTGIMGFKIFLEFDTDVFFVAEDSEEHLQVTAGSAFSSGNMLCSKTKSGISVVWYSSEAISEDGVLFTVSFSATDEAVEGINSVKLSYSAKDTLGNNLEKLSLTCADGALNVLPETAHFRAESFKAVPGSDTELSVMLDANPGIAAFMVYINCDTTIFAAEQLEDSIRVLSGDLGGSLLCSKNGKKGYRIIWYSNNDIYKTGTAFKIPLSVSGSASFGDYDIGLQISEANTCNALGSAVPAEAAGGNAVLVPYLITSASCDFNSIANGVKLDITADISNTFSLNIIAAAYDSAGKMTSCGATAFENEGSSKQIILPCSDASAEVKAFVLDTANYTPLQEAMVFPAGILEE